MTVRTGSLKNLSAIIVDPRPGRKTTCTVGVIHERWLSGE